MITRAIALGAAGIAPDPPPPPAPPPLQVSDGELMWRRLTQNIGTTGPSAASQSTGFLVPTPYYTYLSTGGS